MNQTGIPDSDSIDPTIGERLMVIRRRRGISQRALAKRAQMSVTTLNRLERGLQSTTMEKLATLCHLLDVSSDYILGLRPATERMTLDDAPPRPGPRPGRHVAPVG
jgi:transcriptional regulator with XRE-family HTH domain